MKLVHATRNYFVNGKVINAGTPVEIPDDKVDMYFAVGFVKVEEATAVASAAVAPPSPGPAKPPSPFDIPPKED